MQSEDLEIQRIWDDIDLFLKENAPYVFETLNEGVSPQAVMAFEKHTGLSLPRDYQISLERHNGEVYLYSYCYLPLREVEKNWEMMNRLKSEGIFSNRLVDGEETGALQNLWWHEAWVPFAEDGGGNFLCIDLAPGPKDSWGQIIYVEKGEGAFESEFKSFSEWLIDYRDGLFSGKFAVNRDGGIDET